MVRVGISVPTKKKKRKGRRNWSVTWDYYGAEFFPSRKKAMEFAIKARILGKGGLRLSKYNNKRGLWEDVNLG